MSYFESIRVLSYQRYQSPLFYHAYADLQKLNLLRGFRLNRSLIFL